MEWVLAERVEDAITRAVVAHLLRDVPRPAIEQEAHRIALSMARELRLSPEQLAQAAQATERQLEALLAEYAAGEPTATDDDAIAALRVFFPTPAAAQAELERLRRAPHPAAAILGSQAEGLAGTLQAARQIAGPEALAVPRAEVDGWLEARSIVAPDLAWEDAEVELQIRQAKQTIREYVRKLVEAGQDVRIPDQRVRQLVLAR